MNAKGYLWIGIGATLAFALALLVLASPAAATNDPPSTGGDVYGDWTVTDTRTYSGVVITLWDGSLTIKAGASLTLDATTLTFNTSADGKYGIDVNAQGALTVQNLSTITSSDTAYHYYFKVKGAMTIDSSYISEMWGDNASWAGGIQIYSDSVTINNSIIYKGRTGGMSIFDCSPTITNNTIRDNGQDGASTKYCFGMYVHNSKAIIDYNTITKNVYGIQTSSRNTTSIYDWPTSDQGGGYYSEYDGVWYYGWWNYGYYQGYYTYYRYHQYQIQIYWYNTSSYYGLGVWIEDSDLSLNSNTISQNGLGGKPGYTGIGYNSIREIAFDTTSGPYGSYYHYLTMWYWYEYFYTYQSVTCFGEGLHVENTKLVLEKNTIDQNGFLAKHDTYPSSDAVGWYSGVDVNLYDCTAAIGNNTISSAAIMLNLTRCTVSITANKILGDYIGGGSYYSTCLIPWRHAYGIRYYQSKGDILNNTITFTFKDYPCYVGGQSIYFADLVTAVEMPSAKDTLFYGNKVTIDSQYYGMVRCLLFNTSLKATNLRIIKCQFELKYTSVTSSAKPAMPGLIIGLKSEAYIQDCTFKGPGSGNYLPQIWGINANFGTALTIVDSTFSNYDRALMATDYSSVLASGMTITNVRETGLYLNYQSRANLTNCMISGAGQSVTAMRSTVDLYGCQLSSGVEFYMDAGATINVYNTVHTRAAFIVRDSESRLTVSWPITFRVVWQNGEPVEGARAAISTMTGERVFSGTTNETGYPADILWINEYVVRQMTLYNYNPHRITASKGRLNSLDMYVIDKSLALDFQLVDTVAPDLSLDFPFDGQKLSESMVTFSGRASDPEAGLLDSLIEMNIDNSGWVQVPVNETSGAWSYTRPLGDGLRVVRIKAADQAGNIARESLSVFVDTSGPVLQVFSPAEGSTTSQRTITVMGVSEEGAFVTVNGVNVDLQKRYFSVRVSLEDGPNTVLVEASDAAGNPRKVEVHVFLDSQPPLLDVRSPLNGQYTNQDPVTVAGSSEPNSVVTVNGLPAFMADNSFETLLGLSEGANTVIVRSTDLAGNTATRVLTVYLDTAPPEVTLFTPHDGLYTNQSRVLVNGATEQGATVSINGQNTNVVATVFNGYVSLLEGANRIEVVARDPAGNTRSLARTVRLDTRRPDLIVSTPADHSVLASRVVDVVGSVDFGAEVRINGELVQVVDFVFATTVSYAEDGKVVLEIASRDMAGNTALVTRTIVLDTTTPSLVLSYPPDGLKVKPRVLTVSGQTEPYATVIINTETMLAVGRDGLFQVPVVLEDGDNRITVTVTDAAGNSQTQSVTVMRPVAKAAVKEDLSWALNLTGLLLGMGIALPIMSYALTASWRRRREAVLAEVEAAEVARREREAEEARLAALPKVEKMGKKRARPPEPKKEEKAPEVLPEAPKAESGAPEVAKAGLKDKSGATEVSPDEIDQATKMKAKSESPPEKEPKAEEPESSLKDKGGEAEGEAGDTEIPGK